MYYNFRIQECLPSVCALRLDQSSPTFQKLKNFFKNFFLSLEHLKLRKIAIIPHADYYEFKKD